jgi:hypothetical protein
MLKNPPKTRKAHGCPTGKKRFRDHRAAVSFLHHAANARVAAALDDAKTTHRAVRSYECGLCRGFHVTSVPLAA